MTTYFAVYDDEGIWGVGYTPEQAWADAKKNYDCERCFERARSENDLKVAPASQKLFDHVEAEGGDCDFTVHEGIVKLLGVTK